MKITLHKKYHWLSKVYKEAVAAAAAGNRDSWAAKLLDWLRDEPYTHLRGASLFFATEQSARSVAGSSFEDRLEALLNRAGIPFRSQVPVCRKTGVIADLGKCGRDLNFVDILVGRGIGKGKHIRDFALVSAKTSARNRFEEDERMIALGPARCYMVALNSPPNAERHERDLPVRTRIVTDHPNKSDTRSHKLTTADMIAELKAFVASHP